MRKTSQVRTHNKYIGGQVGQELHIAIAAEARETNPQFWASSTTNFHQSLMNISSQK